MWGQPPPPALSEAEGAVRPSKARQSLEIKVSRCPLHFADKGR